MKNLLKLMGVVMIAFMATCCSNPTKMAKMASLVKTDCTPEILECVAGKIDATYSITFPEKYFITKAVLKVTPVLMYDGGELAGEDFYMQGEKVLKNYQVVPYSTSSTVSRKCSFDYTSGVEKSTLELRAVLYNADMSKSFEVPITFKLAEGTNTTYQLVDLSGIPAYDDDNYQKEFAETYEASILYDLNKSDVKKARLNSDEIKSFEDFVKAAGEDKYTTIESSTITGYASPEGPIDRNNTLAEQRSKTAKSAYDKTISKSANLDVPVTVEDKGEDWEGFKSLVENSDMEDKDLIIRVLSMYSDPQVREREIRNMSQVYQTLTTKVLPQLRRSRIVVNATRKNYSDEELLNFIANGNYNDLDEEALLYAATLAQESKTKSEILRVAADKFQSDRAYNNLAAIALEEGNTSEAESWLGKINDKTSSYYNNMGVVNMQKENWDDAKSCFALADSQEAAANIGAININEGNYQEALKNLEGTTSTTNLGLAKLLCGDYTGTVETLTDESNVKQAYIRAIAAARQGDAVTAENELATAITCGCMEKRLDNDIEFALLR